MFVLIRNRFRPQATTTSRSRIRGVISLCCLAIFTLSIGCNKDSAQWKVAAAVNEQKNANPEAAIELLHEALRLDPESSSIKLRLAYLLAENDQGDLGLMLCDEVLESNPGSKPAWRARSKCLLFLGRFDEALADYQTCTADKIDKGLNELNELAYYRGLAGFELDKALRQVNQGILKYERNQSWGGFTNVPIEISLIVSAGLISRYTDKGHLLALGLLNEQIFEEQRAWLALNASLDRLISKHEQENKENPNHDADAAQTSLQIRQEKRASDNVELAAGNLTVLLATRSLIFEAKGQPELADLDRLWLRRIGHEAEEIYPVLPSDRECLFAMQAGEAILDTRGFILTQMPWQPTMTIVTGKVIRLEDRKTLVSYGSYKQALRDLDIAVAASEIRLEAFDSDLLNRIEIPVPNVLDLKDIDALKAMEARMIAVLRKHRRQAHLKAKQTEAADQDLLRIKELGFEDDSNLF